MVYRISVLLLGTFMCSASMAALIVTETSNNSTKVGRTYTYANAAGDLRIDELSYGSSSSSVTDAAISATNNAPKVNYHLGDIEDTTLFQTEGEAIVMLEGDICRRMTADSAPPPGLGVPGMNLGDHNKQMADAMKQASSRIEAAMEQARKEGSMTTEQERAMKQWTDPFMTAQDIKPRDTLEVESLGERTRVGKYNAEGFLVKDLDGNEKHRVWVVPTGEVAGGAHVRGAMMGMFNTYEKYLDKMGGGALMDTGMATMFRKGELADTYPVRIEDLESGDVTNVVEAHSNGPDVEYYPDCEVKTMFGM